MKPLISIVTPVYNSFHLMERYFDTLEKQGTSNFEVIIVDDCSKDESYKCLKKKIKDLSFVCHLYKTKENVGPGVARNLGVSKCCGKYITFVDSDDYIADNFVEKICEVIESRDVDSLVFDYYKRNENNVTARNTILGLDEGNLNIEDAVALSSGSTWCKVYKIDILKRNNVYFPDLMRGEDLAFNKVALSKCKNIFYLKDYLYYYCENKKSIMHDFNTLNISDNKGAFKYIEDNLKMEDALEMIFVREYLYLITQIMILKKYRNNDIKKFINECFEKFPNWYINKYIKNQPKYLQVMLVCIKHRILFPLRLIFKLKSR